MAIVLTQKTVKTVGIIAISVLTLAGGYALGSPIITDLNNTQEEYATASSQLETQQSNLLKLRESRINFPTIERIDTQLRGQFPELAQTRELLDTLSRAAIASGLAETDLLSVTFRAPQKQTAAPTAPPVADPNAEADGAPGSQTIDASGTRSEFATLEVSLSVQGSPENLQRFLTYMNNTERAFIISTFSVNNREESSILSLTAQVFVYPAIVTPDEVPVDTPTAPPVEPGTPEETLDSE